MPHTRSALLIVDVQNDFCTGGALPVPKGEDVVPPLNGYIDQAAALGAPVYASRDWHPSVTTHFAPYGGPWPVHCVQDSAGALFHPDLRLPTTSTVVTKGDEPHHAGYSAFDGHTADGRALLADLRARGIVRLYVGGLATEYCVKQTVLDGLKAGLAVTLLGDAIAGIEATSGDSARALAAMCEQGAEVVAHADSLDS